jgi:putative FmdB family regulatory protein
MAVYEYRCRVCDTRFEARRPMSEATAPIDCPAGHEDTFRLLSVFASVGASSPRQTTPAAAMPAGGCGAGCACAH